MSYLSLDVDLDDVVSSLSRWDRKELLKMLQDDGYINEHLVITDNGEVDFPSSKHQSTNDLKRSLQILFDQGWRLTVEEERIINKIASRYEV